MAITFLALIALCTSGAPATCGGGNLCGLVTDPQGKPVAGANISLVSAGNAAVRATRSDAEGRFSMALVQPGGYHILAAVSEFLPLRQLVTVASGGTSCVTLQFEQLAARKETLTVTADADDLSIQNPDPAQRVLVREEMLDANPGRPGAPVSIPGVPVETASGGLKAPQYFAPGVAGDHGESIAQFLRVGSYLVPNNLSANAHGNGYADPNVIIPSIIESVQTDGGAFNVQEGDHSVNMSAIYGLRERLEPFVTLTGDYRDVDLAAGWSPGDPQTRAWIAIQASFGNGFLDTLEHRQQYKINGFRVFDWGNHQITLFGIGYSGRSKIPGLVPIGVPNLHDTIDRRQRDQTHTAELAVNDIWRLTPSSQFQFSSFFRAYNLALYSNFGAGLIRQSEFRTVSGGNSTYLHRFNQHLAVIAGADYFREAPRRLDLDRYESPDPAVYGPFKKVTANDVTMNDVTGYAAVDGGVTSWLHYNFGWRRDQINLNNADLLAPANSFQKWVGVNSPKATISVLPPESGLLPSISLSFGETFFTNDPRIGNGTTQGTLVSRAQAYQLVAGKTIWGTDLRMTIGRTTQEASLAKIDPDTGLQFNEGPSRNRYVTVAARRYFRGGSLQGSLSKADARDLSDGSPVPEAPRLIVDFLGTLDRLPFRLRARAEFEEVGRKPLGEGFVGLPVREFRGALFRQFGGRFRLGVNFQIASGYTGQTTEVLALPPAGEAAQAVVGVYLPSYVTLSLNYRLGRTRLP